MHDRRHVVHAVVVRDVTVVRDVEDEHVGAVARREAPDLGPETDGVRRVAREHRQRLDRAQAQADAGDRHDLLRVLGEGRPRVAVGRERHGAAGVDHPARRREALHAEEEARPGQQHGDGR